MGHFFSRFILIIVLGSAVSCASNAGARTPKNTGLFSNMVYNEKGGDVLGVEVLLVNSSSGYFAVYQSSEGEPNKPVVLQASVSGATVEFIVPPEIDSRGLFRGTLTNSELSGTFFGSEEKVLLKRGHSYWN